MKFQINLRKYITETVALLLILLFVYAAVSKIIDYSNFKIQLGQSPILSPFAEWISVLVPAIEFVLVVLLTFSTTRLWGILGSFILMSLFTIYIYILLNYSSYIPCSCGGILEKMTWKQHIIFNLIFVFFTAGAYICSSEKDTAVNIMQGFRIYNRYYSKICILILSALSGVFILILMFRYSDNIIHHHNKFIRRFPQHVAEEIYKIDLKYNSYYFAGSYQSNLYLGNYTAPLQILTFDTLLRSIKKNQITLKEKYLPFKSPQLRVFKQNFFVFEGLQPYLFKGDVGSWNARLYLNDGYFFTQAQPMDSTNLAVRYLVPKSGENALGNLNLNDTAQAAYNSELLQKQFDGIFDTDGILLFNHQLDKMVYVYYYRNEFLVVNRNLKLLITGNTIDTISKAQVKLIQYKNSSMKTFAKPPLMVNRTIATYGRLLFVNSALPGLYESDELWKTASIIDVYDLVSKSYRSSFSVYDVKGRKAKEIYGYGDFLYVLTDTQLICYKLRKYLLQNKSVKESSVK